MAHKINEHVINEDLLDILVNDAKTAEKKLNYAISELNKNTDPEFHITTIEDLRTKTKPEWLGEYLDTEKQRLFDTAYIPRHLRKDFEQKYDEVKVSFTPYIGSVSNCLKKLPPIENFKISADGRFWLDEKELKSWAESRATMTVPPIFREYYERLGAFYDSWSELRKWEKENRFSGVSSGYTAYPSGLGQAQGLVPQHVGIERIFKDSGYLSMKDFCDLINKHIIFAK